MLRDNILRVLVFTIGFSVASWAKDRPDSTSTDAVYIAPVIAEAGLIGR